ncbi:DUF5995 family protein [Streptomyces sp. WMMC905]|uniref:DUF5995 family protein n=1 Tax=Streptomyces sp. WMMC905 TaxID=3404123 RepID=UPI003B935A45
MAQCEQLTTAVGPMVSARGRMRELDSALPPRDGVAIFNRVYLTVAEAVAAKPTGGGFPQVRATIVLVERLAARYLGAVGTMDAGHVPPAAWRPLLRLRRHAGVRPAQFALAAINAHVGHDLTLAVVDACRTLDCEPADMEDDFDRVGDLLTVLEERVHDELVPGPEVLRVTDPLAHLLDAWRLDRARETAWASARALWSLDRRPEVARDFAARLDAGVGLATRLLLTPLPDGLDGAHSRPRVGQALGAHRA